MYECLFTGFSSLVPHHSSPIYSTWFSYTSSRGKSICLIERVRFFSLAFYPEIYARYVEIFICIQVYLFISIYTRYIYICLGVCNGRWKAEKAVEKVKLTAHTYSLLFIDILQPNQPLPFSISLWTIFVVFYYLFSNIPWIALRYFCLYSFNYILICVSIVWVNMYMYSL